MNFLHNKLDLVAHKEVTLSLSSSQRIAFVTAGMIIFLEFLVLWQFMQPISLILSEPTQAPHPIAEREGILKRF